MLKTQAEEQINMSIAFPYNSIDKVGAARHCDPCPYQTITMSEAGTLDEQSMIYMDISASWVTWYWSAASQGGFECRWKSPIKVT